MGAKIKPVTIRVEGSYENQIGKVKMDSFYLSGEWVEIIKKGVVDLRSEREKEVIQEERNRDRGRRESKEKTVLRDEERREKLGINFTS